RLFAKKSLHLGGIGRIEIHDQEEGQRRVSGARRASCLRANLPVAKRLVYRGNGSENFERKLGEVLGLEVLEESFEEILADRGPGGSDRIFVTPASQDAQHEEDILV